MALTDSIDMIEKTIAEERAKMESQLNDGLRYAATEGIYENIDSLKKYFARIEVKLL